MKIDPVNYILEKNKNLDSSFYFITGNEITLMEKIKDTIIKHYSNIGSFKSENIASLKMIKNESGLFENNTIYFVQDVGKVSEDEIKALNISGDIIVFFSENSPRNKNLKNFFLKEKSVGLFDCYELTKTQKVNILNTFLQDKKVKVEQDVFWKILDSLDNKYGLLEKELDKIDEFKLNDISADLIEKVICRNSGETNKIFFEILKSNEEIINIFNKQITNQNELSEFFQTTKMLCSIIINSVDEFSFSQNIPKYLFREKASFISIFKKYNLSKKKRLINLLIKAERDLRKNSALSVIIGLRFFLNLRKITIS